MPGAGFFAEYGLLDPFSKLPRLLLIKLFTDGIDIAPAPTAATPDSGEAVNEVLVVVGMFAPDKAPAAVLYTLSG